MNNEITSIQNPLIKSLVKLNNSSSERAKQGKTILEGSHLTGEYIQFVGLPNICVYSSSVTNLEALGIIRRCREGGVRVIEVSPATFSKINPVLNSVGLIFVIDIPKSENIQYDVDTVILENIQDPGNFGTILRSVAASGVEQIICSRGTVSAWSPKTLRASMGANFRLKIIENLDLLSVIPNFKIEVIATSLTASSSIYDHNLTQKTAWLFGNEGSGLSPEIINLATKKIIIPQKNNVESLNVAMAATVCLFEQSRQRLTNNR